MNATDKIINANLFMKEKHSIIYHLIDAIFAPLTVITITLFGAGLIIEQVTKFLFQLSQALLKITIFLAAHFFKGYTNEKTVETTD